MNTSGFSSISSVSTVWLPADFLAIDFPHQPDVDGVISFGAEVEYLLDRVGVLGRVFGCAGFPDLVGLGSGLKQLAQDRFFDLDDFATGALAFVCGAELDGKGYRDAFEIALVHQIETLGK